MSEKKSTKVILFSKIDGTKKSVTLSEAIKRLVKKKENLNYQSKDRGMSLLHIAVGEEDVEATKLLLEYGADINIKNKHSATPLYIAIFRQNPEIVRILLENGAVVNDSTQKEASALHLAVAGHSMEIVELLVDHGADLHSKDYENDTPLQVAKDYDKDDFVKYLEPLMTVN